MKTQNTKLKFNKSSLVELNDEQLQDINGGSTLSIIVALVVVPAIIAATVEAANEE